jgi:hypothetical protein
MWGVAIEMDKEYLRHLVELEYGICQGCIVKFDDYRAQLKSWMVTGVAALTAAAFGVRSSAIFLAGILMVLMFALAEMHYIDIQDDVITRSKELEVLLGLLVREGVHADLEKYDFGIGKVFKGGRVLKPREVAHWCCYRTFNPFLYGGALMLMVLAAAFAPVGR